MANGKSKRTEVTVLTATDLHQSKRLYAELAAAVELHRPDIVALVGDFLHAGDDMKGLLSAAECAVVLSTLPCHEVIFTRGNHEDENWPPFVDPWQQSKRPLHALNGEVFKFGPLVMVGFPCMLGNEEHFLNGRDPLPYSAEEWLGPLIRMHGKPARTLWLIHEPPKGTVLSAAGSVVEGHQEWTDAIERFNPMLVVSGHDHITPIKNRRWHCKIKNSTCINVGQSEHGPLHFTLIKAKFTSASPSLPSQMTVTAYPIKETICILD